MYCIFALTTVLNDSLLSEADNHVCVIMLKVFDVVPFEGEKLVLTAAPATGLFRAQYWSNLRTEKTS